VVKVMTGRAGAGVASRGQDKYLYYSRGVTVARRETPNDRVV